MGYRVIKDFYDLQDNMYFYDVGMNYPRRGITPTEERIEELATDINKIGVPLIIKYDDDFPDTPKADENEIEKPRKKGRGKNADSFNADGENLPESQ